MVESITYKYINGNLAQEYAANWKVESQNLPSGSTIKTSEVPSQLTITVPANNTSSTRSGKIDTVDPSDWTPSGSYSHGSITVKKGNLSPSDFSGGILIELILGNKINGYVKRVMLRIKIN